mmetsp:Transcript_108919/g.351596  ORF Transcript_108919/g.351596 Transcript_108919/m.351596 type:complete len:270 (+) Transcript_108919:1393-2202(+)
MASTKAATTCGSTSSSGSTACSSSQPVMLVSCAFSSDSTSKCQESTCSKGMPSLCLASSSPAFPSGESAEGVLGSSDSMVHSMVPMKVEALLVMRWFSLGVLAIPLIHSRPSTVASLSMMCAFAAATIRVILPTSFSKAVTSSSSSPSLSRTSCSIVGNFSRSCLMTCRTVGSSRASGETTRPAMTWFSDRATPIMQSTVKEMMSNRIMASCFAGCEKSKDAWTVADATSSWKDLRRGSAKLPPELCHKTPWQLKAAASATPRQMRKGP